MYLQVPLIAIAVGSRGLISQLLGPKFGGFLVYGSLEGKSILGLPTLVNLTCLQTWILECEYKSFWTHFESSRSQQGSYFAQPCL